MKTTVWLLKLTMTVQLFASEFNNIFSMSTSSHKGILSQCYEVAVEEPQEVHSIVMV